MRPKIIAQIHGLHFDLRGAETAEQAADLQAQYEALLKQAASQYGTSVQKLNDILLEDYHKWQQDEGLKPRRR
jgi:hypothetical protein